MLQNSLRNMAISEARDTLPTIVNYASRVVILTCNYPSQYDS